VTSPNIKTFTKAYVEDKVYVALDFEGNEILYKFSGFNLIIKSTYILYLLLGLNSVERSAQDDLHLTLLNAR